MLQFTIFVMYASKQVPGNVLKPNVQRLTNVIEDYLGKDFRMIKNKSGDPVFINADNSRRIRFDSKNPHGDVPHGHVEHYDKIADDWIDYTDKHRIYLRDAMEYLNKPKMGKE